MQIVSGSTVIRVVLLPVAPALACNTAAEYLEAGSPGSPDWLNVATCPLITLPVVPRSAVATTVN